MSSFIIQCHVATNELGQPIERFNESVLCLSAEEDGDYYDETTGWEYEHDWNLHLSNCIYKLTVEVNVEYTKDYWGEVDSELDFTVLGEEKFKTFGDLKRWWKSYKQFI